MRCPLLAELPAPARSKRGWPWTQDTTARSGSSAPRISVVTPSFNQAAYIEETIRSVLLQGYPNLEYIVIDGGSTDGSVDIIRKYEPWLCCWTSERDRGQCDAINKGLARSTGEYFNYVNSDDTLSPGALHAVTDAFGRYPEAALVHGKCVLANQDGVEQSVHQGRGNGFVEMFENLVVGNSLHPLACFFRRAAVDAAGGYREHLHHEMDSDLWFRMLERPCEIRSIDATIGMFRCHQEQKSSSHRRIDELLDVLQAALERRHDLLPEERERLSRMASRQCARQKLWAASSSFHTGRYSDYLSACVDGMRMDPRIVGTWVFWSNTMAPVKAALGVGRLAKPQN